MKKIGSQGWLQFNNNRQILLSEYKIAKTFSYSHKTKTNHGNTAEAIFRKWLSDFLPKKFGVTSGYILSQEITEKIKDIPHWDVIIYNQIECPLLWSETNTDKSTFGNFKAIPAEFVKAIIEVKSNFNSTSIKSALKKINSSKELINKYDQSAEKYPTKIPKDCVLSTVFFESSDKAIYNKPNYLSLLPDDILLENFYGGLILNSSSNCSKNYSTVFKLQSFQCPFSHNICSSSNFSSGIITSESKNINNNNYGFQIYQNESAFSRFAFDLLAKLNNNYDPNFLSSHHGTSVDIPVGRI